jgi:hypothetical protein
MRYKPFDGLRLADATDGKKQGDPPLEERLRRLLPGDRLRAFQRIDFNARGAEEQELNGHQKEIVAILEELADQPALQKEFLRTHAVLCPGEGAAIEVALALGARNIVCVDESYSDKELGLDPILERCDALVGKDHVQVRDTKPSGAVLDEKMYMDFDFGEPEGTERVQLGFIEGNYHPLDTDRGIPAQLWDRIPLGRVLGFGVIGNRSRFVPDARYLFFAPEVRFLVEHGLLIADKYVLLETSIAANAFRRDTEEMAYEHLDWNAEGKEATAERIRLLEHVFRKKSFTYLPLQQMRGHEKSTTVVRRMNAADRDASRAQEREIEEARKIAEARELEKRERSYREYYEKMLEESRGRGSRCSREAAAASTNLEVQYMALLDIAQCIEDCLKAINFLTKETMPVFPSNTKQWAYFEPSLQEFIDQKIPTLSEAHQELIREHCAIAMQIVQRMLSQKGKR